MTTEPCGPEPGIESVEEVEQELAALAKALGHPARVHILRLLLGRDACYCGELVDELPLAQATVSQHLKMLKDAGLVRGEIEGPRVCYCTNRERLHQLAELVAELAETPTPALEEVG